MLLWDRFRTSRLFRHNIAYSRRNKRVIKQVSNDVLILFLKVRVFDLVYGPVASSILANLLPDHLILFAEDLVLAGCILSLAPHYEFFTGGRLGAL